MINVRILVQPADEGPSSRLLEPGPFDAAPPRVVLGGTTRSDMEEARWMAKSRASWTSSRLQRDGGGPIDALPIVWDGEIIRQGRDLLAYGLIERLGGSGAIGFMWDKVPGADVWCLDAIDSEEGVGGWRFAAHADCDVEQIRSWVSPPIVSLGKEAMAAWLLAAAYCELVGGTLIVESEVR